jgi:putative membrane protein
MKATTLILGVGFALAFSTSFAADKEKSDKPRSADELFIGAAADAHMAEVELGKLAEKNGAKEEVKTFGRQMVREHGKANENLKRVAAKMKTTFPDKVRPRRQFKIDKMSKMSGAEFDTTYVITTAQNHEKTVAGFEKARGEVTNPELKKFIEDTLPVLKKDLELAKKMQSAKPSPAAP